MASKLGETSNAPVAQVGNISIATVKHSKMRAITGRASLHVLPVVNDQVLASHES
jgi:hypothetical protein